MTELSNKQLQALSDSPGFMNSLLNPLDLKGYEKNLTFKFFKFISTIIPLIFYDLINKNIQLILIINVFEAVISDYKNGYRNNAYLGMIVALLGHYLNLHNNMNFIIFISAYLPWNLIYCLKNSNFQYGLVHNIIPIVASVFSNEMFKKWVYLRCACISIVLILDYINYSNSKKILNI